MHREHRDLVVLGRAPERVRRPGSPRRCDHDLDAVVPEAGRQLERERGRRVGGRRRERDLGRRGVQRSGRAPGRCRLHAAAGRYGSVSASWSSRRRITPSRNAHGQMSTCSRSSRCSGGVARRGPRRAAAARASARPRAARRGRRRSSPRAAAPEVEIARRSTRWTYGPSFDGAAPVIRASWRNVLEVATPRVRAGRREAPRRCAGDLLADLLAQRTRSRPSRAGRRRRAGRG